MKKVILSSFCICTILVIANWGKQSSDLSGDNKHRINFYGKIITIGNQDQEKEIENISIDNIFKQIPFYVSPTTFTKDINPKDHTLTANPRDILQDVRIDLSEIKSIETKREDSNPVIWEFRDNKSGQKDKATSEFVEIIVTSNDKTKNNYLIELRKNVNFDEKNPAGAIESKINFKGLSKLSIDGYTDRELEKKEKITEEKSQKTIAVNNKKW